MSSVCPSPQWKPPPGQNRSDLTTPDPKVDDEESARIHAQVELLKFVAYGVVGCVVVALGILGNVINLVVLKQPNLKGVTFVYLIWLAAADLMTLLVSITSMMRLHGVQPRSYLAAVYFAHVEVPLVNAFMASSVFLVVALTVDRYFSVCLPTRFKEVHNLRRAKTSIAAAYLVAFALYLPICFQKSPVAVANGTEYVACEDLAVVSHTAFQAYLLLKEVLVRIGPVALLSVLNATIIVTFRKTMKKRRDLLNTNQQSTTQGGGSSSSSSKKFRDERRLLVLLGGIVVLFVLCMTPAAILTILNSDAKENDYSFQVFRAVANCLELANYSMNFYVYCLCSTEIRRTFLALLRCSPRQRQRDANSIALAHETSCTKL